MPYRQFCSPFVLGKARGEVGKANRSVVDENLFASLAKKCLREGEKSEQKRRRRRIVRIARRRLPAGKKKMRTKELPRKICSHRELEIARGEEENANRTAA